jgi:hypothetical protein
MSVNLIIDEEYLKATTPIGDNVDMKILTPVIEWVQDMFILPLLGSDLYEEILTQSTPPTSLSPDNLFLLETYVLKCARFYVMAESVRTFKYRYTNKGIMTATSENGTSITESETESLIDDWKSKASSYGQAMINYIKDNPTKYPKYFTVGGAYKTIPVTTAYDCPIYLPRYE